MRAFILQKMSEEITDVVFLKVDVDACETIAEKYNITSMPTFHFVKEKKQLGYVDILKVPGDEMLADFLTKLLPAVSTRKVLPVLGLSDRRSDLIQRTTVNNF